MAVTAVTTRGALCTIDRFVMAITVAEVLARPALATRSSLNHCLVASAVQKASGVRQRCALASYRCKELHNGRTKASVHPTSGGHSTNYGSKQRVWAFRNVGRPLLTAALAEIPDEGLVVACAGGNR